MHYVDSYYEKVYAGFDDREFARKWALGCAITAGYADLDFDAVLEFGAGLGQNLEVIHARRKWAVDVSDASRRACQIQGIEWRDSLDAVPNESFQMILSRHSLEHVPDPLNTLIKLREKAVPGAQFYLVVPLEHSLAVTSLEQFDEHKHLFSWSPESLKNLLLEAGWAPKTIRIHSGRLLRRMLFMLPRFPHAFGRARRCVTALTPSKSAEIIVRADCKAS